MLRWRRRLGLARANHPPWLSPLDRTGCYVAVQNGESAERAGRLSPACVARAVPTERGCAETKVSPAGRTSTERWATARLLPAPTMEFRFLASTRVCSPC